MCFFVKMAPFLSVAAAMKGAVDKGHCLLSTIEGGCPKVALSAEESFPKLESLSLPPVTKAMFANAKSRKSFDLIAGDLPLSEALKPEEFVCLRGLPITAKKFHVCYKNELSIASKIQDLSTQLAIGLADNSESFRKEVVAALKSARFKSVSVSKFGGSAAALLAALRSSDRFVVSCRLVNFLKDLRTMLITTVGSLKRSLAMLSKGTAATSGMAIRSIAQVIASGIKAESLATVSVNVFKKQYDMIDGRTGFA